MWVLISLSRSLKFYDLKSKDAIEVHGLNYFIEKEGCSPKIVFDHNFAISRILQHGIPVFENKTDARKIAVSEGLTGFKYLELKPSIIMLLDNK